MKFLDKAKIYTRSGNGGNGCVSFRREKYVEFGGPDGGNGGNGGHIIFEANDQLNTLIDFRYRQHFKASHGKSGAGKNKTGAQGEDLIIDVPVGTQIFDESGELLLADLIKNKQQEIILHGGHGGRGNQSYKSSINRAPRDNTQGEKGQEAWLWLHLKLLAQIGLVGMPNAGKSSLMQVLTNSKSKIGDYPFTTLYPQLGMLDLDNVNSLIIADIPGLIEGASDGKGIGDQFLGHVERCRILLHLIDISHHDIHDAYNLIRKEIHAYNPTLSQKHEIIALTKSDIIDSDYANMVKKSLSDYCNKRIFVISNHTYDGIDALTQHIGNIFQHISC